MVKRKQFSSPPESHARRAHANLQLLRHDVKKVKEATAANRCYRALMRLTDAALEFGAAMAHVDGTGRRSAFRGSAKAFRVAEATFAKACLRNKRH